jgi:hypothetical protein
MSEKKKYLLRLDENIYAGLEKWAGHDLRSVNAQIEFLLTEALRRAGRLKSQGETSENDTNSVPPSSTS